MVHPNSLANLQRGGRPGRPVGSFSTPDAIARIAQKRELEQLIRDELELALSGDEESRRYILDKLTPKNGGGEVNILAQAVQIIYEDKRSVS